MRDYLAGMRTSIHGNAAAYAYSVMITCALAVLSQHEGPVSTGRIFLFLTSAAIAFTAVEAVGSDFFRDRSRSDPSEVVVLGAAMGLVTIAIGVAVVVAVDWMMDGWLTWLVAPGTATVAYLFVSALEMALARKAEIED